MAKAKSHPANTESAPVTAPWSTDIDTSSAKTLTLPPTLRIADMPVGAAVKVRPYDLVPSQKKSIKNPLMLATNLLDYSRIAIPVVGGLAGTLLADKDCDLQSVNSEDLAEGLRGSVVVIKKIGYKESSEWKDDSGNPRKYPIFEVSILE
jgi:hypothetical protein